MIKTAIPSVFQDPAGDQETSDPWGEEPSETGAGATIDAITQLAPVDRFVFVM